MESVSNDDLRAILNYLHLNTSGSRDILLERIRENCNSNIDLEHSHYQDVPREYSHSSTSEADDSVTGLPDLQGSISRSRLMRQTSDTVNPHGNLLNRVYLFNSLIFIDVYDDDENDRLCLRMTFPKTSSGVNNNRYLIKTYQDLLAQNSREDLIKLNIFIPSFVTTSGKLFICDLDMYDSRRRVRYTSSGEVVGDKILNIKTAKSMRMALSPNSNSLFKLLECVMISVEYLYRIRFNLQSLDLETIIYSNPAQFLITSFSSHQIDVDNYKIQLTRFLSSVIKLCNQFVIDGRASSLDRETIIYITNRIDVLLLRPLKSASYDRIDNVLTQIFKNYYLVKKYIEEKEEEKRRK